MKRLGRARLTALERCLHPDGPRLGRLLFQIPDLWPEQDQDAFHAGDLETLGDLVER